MTPDPVIEAAGLVKHFGETKALRGEPLGQLGAEPFDDLERLGLPTLCREHPHEQRGRGLVRRRCGREPAQVRLVGQTAAGEPCLRAHLDDIGEQGHGPAAPELGCVGEQGTGRVRRTPSGLRLTRPQLGTCQLDQPAGLDGVDLDIVRGQPVAPGHCLDRQPEPAHPRHESLHGPLGVVGRDVPHHVDERRRRDRPSTRVDELAHRGRQPFAPDRPAVEGERAEGGDAHGPSIAHHARPVPGRADAAAPASERDTRGTADDCRRGMMCAG